LAIGLCLASVWASAADDTLAAAYGAILRGDWQSGQATVERLLERQADPGLQKVHDWLETYQRAVASRRELKSRTFEWNVEQAKRAASQDEIFLALSFAAQAVPYAAEGSELTEAPWMTELAERCKASARELEQAGRWTNALNCYLLLGRIYPGNEEIGGLSENAARHARIELVYPTEKAVQERIRGVNKGLLRTAVRFIDQLYYREPDFKELAAGGLDHLLTVCDVTKLRSFMDGLANPALREHFLRRLGELRAQLESEKSYTYKDLLRLFNQVNDLNRESIEIPEGLLVIEFLEGVASKLDDYSGMVWPADAADFEKMMMGGFEGVGIQLGIDERSNRLKVVTPLENSPALEAGIQPDDVIIAVNGESTAGWTTDDAVRNIMGPAGTEVVLTLQRPRTGETIPARLVRRRIVLTTVRGVERVGGDGNGWNYMLDKDAGVAYIRLSGFHPDSAGELRDALREARSQGMRGLVLDVRHNPGGLLDVAIDIVSTFVEQGDVVSTRGRLETERRETVSPGNHVVYKDLPLVVLVNEGSASASEILAGALQDHHRAIILGDRTFGKGSVQHVRPLSDDARLKLTTALYYLPSGRTPHKAPKAEDWGVDPDWELKLTPKEFRRVLERERESLIIHNEGSDTGNTALSQEERAKILENLKAEDAEKDVDPPLLSEQEIKLLESDPNEAPKTDPQLETALLLMRVKLAADLPWPPELASARSSQR
jgi:carboxyl-terminal processing protease